VAAGILSEVAAAVAAILSEVVVAAILSEVVAAAVVIPLVVLVVAVVPLVVLVDRVEFMNASGFDASIPSFFLCPLSHVLNVQKVLK